MGSYYTFLFCLTLTARGYVERDLYADGRWEMKSDKMYVTHGLRIEGEGSGGCIGRKDSANLSQDSFWIAHFGEAEIIWVFFPSVKGIM